MPNNDLVSYQDLSYMINNAPVYTDISDAKHEIKDNDCECEVIPMKGEDKKISRGDLLVYHGNMSNNESSKVTSSDLDDVHKKYDSKYDTLPYTHAVHLIMKDLVLKAKETYATKSNDDFYITDIHKGPNSYEIEHEKIDNLISDYLNFYNICSTNNIKFMKEIYLEENFVFGKNDNTQVRRVTTFHYANAGCKERDFFNMQIRFYIDKSGDKEADGDAIFYTNIKTKALYDCLTQKDINPFLKKNQKDAHNTVEISFSFLDDKELEEIKQQRKKEIKK